MMHIEHLSSVYILRETNTTAVRRIVLLSIPLSEILGIHLRDAYSTTPAPFTFFQQVPFQSPCHAMTLVMTPLL